jgi:hypothetical protein
MVEVSDWCEENKWSVWRAHSGTSREFTGLSSQTSGQNAIEQNAMKISIGCNSEAVLGSQNTSKGAQNVNMRSCRDFAVLKVSDNNFDRGEAGLIKIEPILPFQYVCGYK